MLLKWIYFSVLLEVAFSRFWRPSPPADEECSASNVFCHAQQVHIAFGEKTNDLVVTWSTMNDTKESLVEYGEDQLDKKATGSRTKFVDGGVLKHFQFIHRVTLKDLKFNTKYVYRVGSKYNMSEKFSFQTPPEGEFYPVHALFFGDMGIPHGKDHKSLQGLIQEINTNHYDMVVHNGDFAYDFEDQNGTKGDDFMNMIQPLAANIQYMVAEGNHETQNNFSHYKNRFSMPGGTDNMFYSFNLGLVHFIAVHTEVYHGYDGRGPFKEEVQTHYNWLVDDLKEATKEENRAKRPWIILFGHRPMYCTSSTGWDGCRVNGKDADYPQKVGIKEFGGLGMEKILVDMGVDLVIWAHEHQYERMWPLYNGTVYNGTEGAYINPGAPTHVTSGAAGNKEGEDKFFDNPRPWSAVRSSDYGYLKLRVHNRTHLTVEEMSTDKYELRTLLSGEKVFEPKKIDEFTLVRDKHVPYDIKTD